MKKLIGTLAVAAMAFGVLNVAPAQADCDTETGTLIIETGDTGTGASAAVYEGGDWGHFVVADTGQNVTYCSDGTLNGIADLVPLP